MCLFFALQCFERIDCSCFWNVDLDFKTTHKWNSWEYWLSFRYSRALFVFFVITHKYIYKSLCFHFTENGMKVLRPHNRSVNFTRPHVNDKIPTEERF